MFPRPKNLVSRNEEAAEMAKLPKASLETSNLREIDDFPAMFWDLPEWQSVSEQLNRVHPIEDMKTGGVNPGDRRAIYHLTRYLKPARVLEIGTHVCASTIHIAAALRENGGGELHTADIEDVNAPNGYWKQFGLSKSPARALSELGLAVSFHVMPSLQALATLGHFDFIFLDGDHAAAIVYQEIPLSLKRLRNGVILLHDYFPNNKPLWSNGSVIPGPFMAFERLRSEGGQFTISPLGALPWPTKLGSNVTSLALMSA